MIKLTGLRGLLIPLCLGFLCALLATYLLVRHVQSIEQQTYLASQLAEPKQVAKKAVVVASVELEAGDILHEKHLRVRELDATIVPIDSIHPADIAQFFGAKLRADIGAAIPAGIPIQKLHLQQVPVAHGLNLAAGMVPFSLPVNSLESHAGMLVVGDVVDLYQYHQGKATLLSDRLQVLATGSQRERVSSIADANSQHIGAYAAPQYQQITLAVPLRQLALLQQLAQQQQLLPVLRDVSDKVRIVTLAGVPAVEIIHAGQAFHQHGNSLAIANSQPWAVDSQQTPHWEIENNVQ